MFRGEQPRLEGYPPTGVLAIPGYVTLDELLNYTVSLICSSAKTERNADLMKCLQWLIG